MRISKLFKTLLLGMAILTSANANAYVASQSFSNGTTLDWTVTGDTINFKLSGPSDPNANWLFLGWSDSSVAPVDGSLVDYVAGYNLGTVMDANTLLIADTFPAIGYRDNQQDIFNAGVTNNGSAFSMEFSRKLVTGDFQNDVDLSLNKNIVFISAFTHSLANDAFGYTNKATPGAYSTQSIDLSRGIAPVPEPETNAMMLAGLGMLGFMVRRRKNDQA
jgi:hypothetical protein